MSVTVCVYLCERERMCARVHSVSLALTVCNCVSERDCVHVCTVYM